MLIKENDMADFFEIDFLDVESDKSGDAICIRYSISGIQYIHVVDGGFVATGDAIVNHINKYYDSPTYIDNVVLSHNDSDHAGGLRKVLESYEIGALWMLRPWLYADEIIHRFEGLTSVEHLRRRLKAIYSNTAALEEIALANGINIYEPFQGAKIGAFTVMSPTKATYLDLIVESEKTPESVEESQKTLADTLQSLLKEAVTKVSNYVKAVWGEETFSTEETSAENEMSVVQYSSINDKKILLTADAGRRALTEAADFSTAIGLLLPGIDKFQVPHHGSRRNVSTELLDKWLGPRLASQPAKGEETFTAIVSSALKDKDHPRKAVKRAFIHRGAKFLETESISICIRSNAPERDGWVAASSADYPDENED
jgi:beta-lactamase superfamily II metal-dependent hydrolase